MPTVTYVKGMKMRTDVKVMNQDISIVIDAAAKQRLMIDHVAKQVGDFDPQAAMAAMPVNIGDITASVKPNGQTKEVLGRTCTGFDVTINGVFLGSDPATRTIAPVVAVCADQYGGDANVPADKRGTKEFRIKIAGVLARRAAVPQPPGDQPHRMERHLGALQDHPLATALRLPGIEMQRLFTTSEPTEDQLDRGTREIASFVPETVVPFGEVGDISLPSLAARSSVAPARGAAVALPLRHVAPPSRRHRPPLAPSSQPPAASPRANECCVLR